MDVQTKENNGRSRALWMRSCKCVLFTKSAVNNAHTHTRGHQNKNQRQACESKHPQLFYLFIYILFLKVVDVGSDDELLAHNILFPIHKFIHFRWPLFIQPAVINGEWLTGGKTKV